MKKLLLIFMLAVSSQSYALEVSGVKLEDTVKLDNHQLVLNGAGLRTKFIARVYVVAIYLSEKTHTAEAVLADKGAKRISLHMVRDVGSKLFFDGLNASILANHSEAEMTALDPKVDRLLKFISTIPELKNGETLYLDYIPGIGTKILINGLEKGIIEGADFYPALLKIWIGQKPVNKALKQTLLGEETEK
jgi:hypothetical protein